ncbi:MAG: zinc-ribbon domain-containing protein [Pyrinomonadaceae bacterium]|nr:zinc-ribbon domain-containing protein [Pyrinomonadaceae bacterium]MCX7640198.1 zinc-ribbon domain-containing protein [Pyrinomonadaceae bacterium]MDW8303214.1 zinc-ribbon domain-containing protein [Acidobacteriota bacterium]
MIIRCDSCSVSLQLDETKIPKGNFTVRCPRCQNLIRVQANQSASPVDHLKENKPAPAVPEGAQKFMARESEFEINQALRALLMALKKEGKVLEQTEEDEEKPRRVLICLGKHREKVAKLLIDAGYKVYIAENPGQANERLREGKVQILILSPDFAQDMGGAAIVQQRINAMYSSERRKLFLVSIDDSANTLDAQEAFLRNLNLVVNTRDVEQLPLILNRAIKDFNDLYHYYNIASGFAGI